MGPVVHLRVRRVLTGREGPRPAVLDVMGPVGGRRRVHGRREGGAGATATRLAGMPRIVVEVMPKPEILDPQGTAITHAMGRLGFAGLGEVRQGKRFELTVDVADEATLAKVHDLAGSMLSNPVIEDVVSVHVTGEDGGPEVRP